MRSSKRSAGPVGDQEVLKVLLQSKDRGVFNGWVLTDECLSLRLSLDQLLQLFPLLRDFACRSYRPRGMPKRTHNTTKRSTCGIQDTAEYTNDLVII